jgi:hypothetical protein
VEKAGRTWRVHECGNRECKKIFISIQTALTAKDAGPWVDVFSPSSPERTGSTSTSPEAKPDATPAS